MPRAPRRPVKQLNVYVDPDLVRLAKHHAVDAGRTLSDVVETALRGYLERTHADVAASEAAASPGLLAAPYEIAGPDSVDAAAVLLHPHPQLGGTRHHPFVSALFRDLPAAGIGAVRFDFTSAEPSVATADALAAVELAARRWPGARIVVAGYSFGAGIALAVDHERVAGWLAVAPPLLQMPTARSGGDQRPKRVVLPEFDQFTPLDDARNLLAEWRNTEVVVVDDDHFLLRAIDDVAHGCIEWLQVPPNPEA